MENALNLIKEFEGLRLEAYRCPSGVWTIGWGHTSSVRPNMKITVAEAERLLRADAEIVDRALREVELTPQQRAALVSFGFNVGVDALRRSTLLRKVRSNASDPTIEAEFMRWIYGGGRVLQGLVRRRRREAEVYFSEGGRQ